jgi:hypothetical protein
MKEKEIWKDIPNYEGYYQVSSFGGVRSVDRVITKGNGVKQKTKGKVLKPLNIGNGWYVSVSLYKNKKVKQFKIHQLVAMAFLGHKPCGFKLVVNHKNFIKTDNRLENLEIVTMRENTSYKQKKSSSQYTGVFLSKYNTWVSKINYKDKHIHLGTFDCEKEASKQYQEALKAIENGTEIKVKRRVYSSKHYGVFFDKSRNKWIAQTRIDGKLKYLGSYKNEEDAYLATKQALKK